MKKVVIATRNEGKVREFKNFFARYNITIYSLNDLGIDVEIEEDGTTFTENALIKARTIAKAYGLNCIADDSGLEVDALDGAPGIHSARYADDHDDDKNNEKLLQELEGVPFEERTARFVCAIAYVTKDLRESIVTGTVEGYIWFEPRGNNGFGYDPLFYVPCFEKTMAELTVEEKRLISHRGHALKKMIQQIEGERYDTHHRSE